MKHWLTHGRAFLLMLLLSQIANESSNSMAAAVFPWLAAEQAIAPHIMLAALAALCLMLAGVCFAMQKIADKFDLLKLWWPTCWLSAATLLFAILMPGNSPAILAIALLVLACAEPIIELGSSVLLPEVAAQSGLARQKLNALMLGVGALSTAAAPLTAPLLAHQLNNAQLLDLVLALALFGLVCLLPLRPLTTRDPQRSGPQEGIAAPARQSLAQTLNLAAPALCLLIGFESVLLPSFSLTISASEMISQGPANALLLQSWFVAALALGVAAGAWLSVVQPLSSVARWLIPTAAIGALIVSCSMRLDSVLLIIGAVLSGVALGIELPKIEANLQALAHTPRARIAPILRFSVALLWRCAFGFMLLAALSLIWMR